MGRDRRARNESFLRDVNDHIEEIAQAFSKGDQDPAASEAEFLCECGHEQCREMVRLSVRAYEAIRREQTLFVVFPGHEDARVEDIVARSDGYVVVRKHPEDAALAQAADSGRH